MAKMRSSGNFLNATAPYYNELAAVVYADLFGYPLTIKEAKLWAIRKQREKSSGEKEKIARQTAAWLKKIPTVAAVFLTGSVAARNAIRKADADIMVITQPNTLWLTRLLVFPWLKRRVCPNIFLDLNHLEITDRNLFTAHEILQAKCLYDRGEVEKQWLEANNWTRDYLPKVFKLKIVNCKLIENCKLKIENWWLVPFELIAFVLQYIYQKPKQTNEKLGWGYAFFHPNNLSQKVLKKFEQRLLKYTNK